MISSIIQALFKIKIPPNMSEQEKKRQRIYDLLNAESNPKFLCLPYTNQRKGFFSQKKRLLRKMGSGGLNQKRKEGFLTLFATVFNKDIKTSIRRQ